MAFANELVPESYKDKIPLLEKSRYGGAAQKELYKWTIDRDRDVYMVILETGGGISWNAG